MRSSRFFRVVPALATLVCATLPALGGDLNPPAGPITSTMKPLTDVEPRIAINATNTPGTASSVYKITTAGSYILTAPLTGVSGKNGIEITASNVSIDLNGFTLTGVAGSFDGIRVASSASGLLVENGTITAWGTDGADLANASGSVIRNVRCLSNGSVGFRMGLDSEVIECTAKANTSTGFVLSSRCRASGCVSVSNGQATSIGHGIGAGSDCIIVDCVCNSNGTGTNGGTGILAGQGCYIRGCAVSQNGAVAQINNQGISVGSACSILDCVCILNRGDGIQVAHQCLVRGNNCIANGFQDNGAGIHVTGNDSRIEDNNCTGATRGIDVDAPGNVIVRNVCSSNATNWDVVASNIILVVNANTAGAVVGNSGGAAPGSTDPNANFTY